MTDTWVREAVPADEVLGPLCEAFGHYQWVHLWGPLNVADPNIHVNMLGVPPRYQGRGLGRLLLERVHAMSREHPGSRGVSLTTESAANVPFYQRLGYRIVGQERIGQGLELGVFPAGLSRAPPPATHFSRRCSGMHTVGPGAVS